MYIVQIEPRLIPIAGENEEVYDFMMQVGEI